VANKGRHIFYGLANNYIAGAKSIEREVNDMTKTLYVGNLPWSTTDTALSEAFSEYGSVVSSRIITDRETGRSRGFGFVEVDDSDVDTIVSAMNGSDFDGRQIVVNEAKARQD
jgi:RNA recognition motif-containing protein